MFHDAARPIGTRSCLFLVLLLPGLVYGAGPEPGDVFREYMWTNVAGDAGGSLRVGGRLDYGGTAIPWPQAIDLDSAVRAEVVLEKLLCHDGTHGLAVSINGHDWIPVPEAKKIPEPQWDYQHHIYPVVPVTLEQLRAGEGNAFRLRVDSEHRWQWPQHLIYGVHLRVYYDPARKIHPQAELVEPADGGVLGRDVTLRVVVRRAPSPIARVDFIGEFEGVNLEGDGQYTQWHYHYVCGKLAGQLGTCAEEPWACHWNTEWVPDQQRPIRLTARVVDQTGLVFMTPATQELHLERPGLKVELCKPYDVPRRWVTRTAEQTQKFSVRGDLSRAIAALLVWCSWSPGYMEGVFVNGQKVLQRDGPRYAYFVHQVALDDLTVLRPGENALTTGLTPKVHGQMVHGMEVNWPGIMVLIQYRD